MKEEKPHKAGFVNIIGNPNVGKSTLMNQLVGEKLSIITSKAQTTRHRIQGIVSGVDFQIVYSDTPGIVDPAYKMHEGMMSFVESSLVDADLILYITEVGETQIKNEKIIERLKKTSIPIQLVVNKIDSNSKEEIQQHINTWTELLPQAEITKISALKGTNVDRLLKRIIKKLPLGPAYFPKDELTDKPMRFFMSEIIREKIFLNYKKEIPYACEVVVEEFKEGPDRIDIRAEIFVERNTQKGILIGHKGQALKKVGTDARADMEKFLEKHVYLDLFIKINKDWRNRPRELKKYGYIN